ncbi:hypothetical protein [Hymenobacter negativus]|uniref:Alpha/beta hydrolase n=1 Tax=Hymenobacter negativus TaxID=2795026 RepID=A0ABS3QKB0_9BACT|nr:hypothetical protein [Hymenobacter negativus]MBO2011686.1 hypothetical protein [Hymenobacter negativus]
MDNLQGFPYFPVEFAKDGSPAQPAQVDALLDGLKAQPTTDLIVLSHGWNNDMAEARDLYQRFLGCVRPLLDDPQDSLGLAGRRFAVLGVLWPSKKFADAQLIPSGAAGFDSPVTNTMLVAELERLKGTFDAPDADAKLTRAQALVPQLDSDPAQNEFAQLLKEVLPPAPPVPGLESAADFMAMDGTDMFATLSIPPPATDLQLPDDGSLNSSISASTAPDVDHAAGIGSSLFGGIKAAAMNVLNLTTYYQMKDRAGTVGQGGVNAVLRRVRQELPAVRLHLVGHSFGCRLLSAAVAGADAAHSVMADSMTLLQGAFSHYGFSGSYDDGGHAGFFRRVVSDKLVAGPIVVSHTRNDSAVGTMYPLASRLAGQVGQGLGDANDKFGGLGSNGAQKTTEATDGLLEDVGFAYPFGSGQIYNLRADTYISGHSDICHPQTAYAFLKAVTTV